MQNTPNLLLNIQPKQLQHTYETVEIFKTCAWNTWKHLKNNYKHKQHLDKTLVTYVWNICNIQINTFATYVWKNRWNIRNRHLQHTCTIIATYATPKYNFANFRMKHLKHAYETSKTLKTRLQHGRAWACAIPAVGVGAGIAWAPPPPPSLASPGLARLGRRLGMGARQQRGRVGAWRPNRKAMAREGCCVGEDQRRAESPMFGVGN
jgi:hypothetical protein